MASDLRKIAEGREAEIYAWQDGSVLRLLRNPLGAQQIEREAEAMRTARAAGVAVPAVREVTTVDGRPGLVMERLDGIDLLTLVGRQPWLVWSAATVTGRLHAELHDVVAPDDLPDLKSMLRRHIEQAQHLPRDLASFALGVLDTLPGGDRICHNDFHPGNIIRSGKEHAIIDWANVRRGDPIADHVRTDLMIRIGDIPPGAPLVIRVGAKFARSIMRISYHRAYRRGRPVDRELADRWLVPVMANRVYEGIEPERAKLLEMLESARARVS